MNKNNITFSRKEEDPLMNLFNEETFTNMSDFYPYLEFFTDLSKEEMDMEMDESINYDDYYDCEDSGNYYQEGDEWEYWNTYNCDTCSGYGHHCRVCNSFMRDDQY